MTDQTACREQFEEWLTDEVIRNGGTGFEAALRHWAWKGYQAAWNSRAPSGGEAVAEVCYDSYGFGRLVWLKDHGKGNQPPHGSLLYIHPPTTPVDVETLKALVGRWRDTGLHLSADSAYLAASAMRACADELEAAINKMTK